MPDLFSLKDKVVLMTGGSRGLGFAMARAMAQHGAHVVLHGRHRHTVEAKANELSAAGLAASALPFDVAFGQHVDGRFRRAVDVFFITPNQRTSAGRGDTR